MYMVIESKPDKDGRVSFTMFWSNPDGVDDPSPQQIRRKRAQCFHAVPEDYTKRGDVVLCETEAEAKAKAWND
jgi:hypothetical protein